MRCLCIAVLFLWPPCTVHSQPQGIQQANIQAALQQTLSGLDLDPALRVELENALQEKDLKTMETLLVEEANRDPKSVRTARLLDFAGEVFFLDGAYLNSAIAWEKARAIAPLDERTRFTLAMDYVKLRRAKWARLELQKLASEEPGNPLYLYWLGRLDYDDQNYADAIARLKQVIHLDPHMARAYDVLGLSYDYLAQMDDAMTNFTRAVELNRAQARPSPWPNLDMAICQIELNDLDGAEKNLREAIAYDPHLAQAQYHLARIFEKQRKYQEAINALNTAATLDPTYPEPHYWLGRIYQRLGNRELARNEIEKFQALRNPPSMPSAGAPPLK